MDHLKCGLWPSGNPILFKAKGREIQGVYSYKQDIIIIEYVNCDDFTKSQKSRHSCESRSPALLELTGFPPSRE
jgi:hypothetical protein